MNTANLQLEGLYLAVAAIARALVAKGVLTPAEIGAAMDEAERAGLSPERTDELSPAQREAIAFPPRLLKLAVAEGPLPSFTDLARRIGQAKDERGAQARQDEA